MGSASLTSQPLHKEEDKGKPSQDEITLGIKGHCFTWGLQFNIKDYYILVELRVSHHNKA